MGLFNKNNVGAQKTPRQLSEGSYTNARNNILLVVLMTAVNIILLVTNSNTYFLFSAYIPYFLADLGMFLCGMYPSEIYAEDFAGMEFLPKSYLAVYMGIVAVILILYILSWVLSKKPRVGWLIFALVFFSIDTVAMFLLNGFVADSVIDYVIHTWVIISFIVGISAHFKLKKMPENEDFEFEELSAKSDNIEISNKTAE